MIAADSPYEIVREAAALRDRGINPDRWARLLALLSGWCANGNVPAVGLLLIRRGVTAGPILLGRCSPAPDARTIGDDAIFLVASLTKPVVALGALILIERGLLCLDDRVIRFLPEFGREGKRPVTVRHLLTHSSGLPDLPADNMELRSAQAPLEVFLERACCAVPAFPAGCGVQYQSLGFMVMGEIIRQVAEQPCWQFLHDEIFEPLGMHDTALGAPAGWCGGPAPKADRIVDVRLPPEQHLAPQGNWNSRYWRTLGAPWGGLLSTPADLGRFASLVLNGGRAASGRQILSPAAIAASTVNQVDYLRGIPEDDRRCRGWGFGWRMNWPGHASSFADFLGPRAFGHWGATGTLMWIAPDLDACCVLLTTQPQEPGGGYLSRASNAVVATLV